MEKLTGNVGVLTLTNFHSLVIKVNESGDGVQYQWQGGEQEQPIYEAEIEYIEDTENITGYAEDEDGLLQAAFKTEAGEIFFLGQFMRCDI